MPKKNNEYAYLNCMAVGVQVAPDKQGRREWFPVQMQIVEGRVVKTEVINGSAQVKPTQAYLHCAARIERVGSWDMGGADLWTGEQPEDRARRERANAKETGNG